MRWLGGAYDDLHKRRLQNSKVARWPKVVKLTWNNVTQKLHAIWFWQELPPLPDNLTKWIYNFPNKITTNDPAKIQRQSSKQVVQDLWKQLYDKIMGWGGGFQVFSGFFFFNFEVKFDVVMGGSSFELTTLQSFVIFNSELAGDREEDEKDKVGGFASSILAAYPAGPLSLANWSPYLQTTVPSRVLWSCSHSRLVGLFPTTHPLVPSTPPKTSRFLTPRKPEGSFYSLKRTSGLLRFSRSPSNLLSQRRSTISIGLISSQPQLSSPPSTHWCCTSRWGPCCGAGYVNAPLVKQNILLL